VKEFPKALEAERAVLGGLIRNPDLIAEVLAECDATDFAGSGHGKLLEIIKRVYREEGSLDLITLMTYIGGISNEDISDMGGVSYISSLPEHCVSTLNLGHYAKIIREKSIRRRLMFSAEKLRGLADNSNLSVDNLIEQGQRDLLEVAGLQTSTDWVDAKTLSSQAVSTWEERTDKFREGAVAGIKTGLSEVDGLICGMETGLYLLAARPSMGKTALALNITLNALKENVPVAFFSLEMDAQQLIDRMAACLSGINAWKIKTGDLSSDDWRVLDEDVGTFLDKAPLYVQDEAGITCSQIHAKARRLKVRRKKLGLIVVDYLQLIKMENSESQEQGVSQLSASMKNMSKELQVPVLCLAQLNRSCETRGENKRPRLSDLRGSGSLEQDADVVMFLYRASYYNTGKNEREAELLVRKHRNGPIGEVKLDWDKDRQRFSDWAAPMQSPSTGRIFGGGKPHWSD